jgi:hypothetical protein
VNENVDSVSVVSRLSCLPVVIVYRSRTVRLCRELNASPAVRSAAAVVTPMAAGASTAAPARSTPKLSRPSASVSRAVTGAPAGAFTVQDRGAAAAAGAGATGISPAARTVATVSRTSMDPPGSNDRCRWVAVDAM